MLTFPAWRTAMDGALAAKGEAPATLREAERLHGAGKTPAQAAEDIYDERVYQHTEDTRKLPENSRKEDL